VDDYLDSFLILVSDARYMDPWTLVVKFCCGEKGKKEVYCDKQVGKAVTVLNCVLKGLWGEEGSGGIRKKLKSEYAAYLESKYRRNDGSSI